MRSLFGFTVFDPRDQQSLYPGEHFFIWWFFLYHVQTRFNKKNIEMYMI